MSTNRFESFHFILCLIAHRAKSSSTHLPFCFKILIERPNNKKTPRTQRKRHTEWDNNIKYNYIINNDSTIENLKKQTQLVIKAIKQYEQDLQKIRDKKYDILINHVLNNHLKNKNNKKGE